MAETKRDSDLGENPPTSPTEILELAGFISAVAYSYTLGTFHNIGIPYYPDFADSFAHYTSTLFLAPISAMVFWLFDGQNFWQLTLVFISMTGIFLGFNYVQRHWLKSRKSAIDVSVPIILMLLQTALTVYFGTKELSQTFTDIRWFGVFLFSIAVSHMALIVYYFRSPKAKARPLMVIGFTALACISSYCITRSHSGNFFSFDAKIKVKDGDDAVRLVWADSDNIFIARCPETKSWKLEGYSSGTLFHTSYLNDIYHRGICDEVFRSKRRGKSEPAKSNNN